MTFTEAAVEVLRRAGKPLHFKDITELALKENLLSHVGQDPEVTMGQRLAAMAKREDGRRVLAVAPDGTFALSEWNVPAEAIVEPVAPPSVPDESGDPLYRPREREPRAIHAQARRRLAELQAEHEDGHEEVEAERRRQDQARAKGQRRYPPPAEVVFEALAQRQTGAPLGELAADLLRRQLLSDGLVNDLPSLVAALLEDNRRRTEAGRKPAFIVDGERVTLVEFPPPSAVPEAAELRAPHAGARPMGGAQLAAEGRRAVVRALRRRVAELETSAFEALCSLLLEKMGMRDIRVAKRSKEGPLYLARQRRGLSDLRVAVKLVRGAREIGRGDVQELRKDLAHYSAQMGLQAPVALYCGEALPEEMIALRVGVTVQTVEVADVDEAVFAGLGRHREDRPRREREERSLEEPLREQEAPAASLQPATIEGAPEAAAVAEASPQIEPAPASEPQTDVPPATEPQPDAAATPVGSDEQSREGRRPRRGGREDRPRATTASEQAWGQPAGTLRFTPPPGPTVAEAPLTEAVAPAESAPAEATAAAAEEGEPPVI